MEKQFYTCKKEKIDGHGWSDSGENDALALYVLHAFFPGQHLSAVFQDLTDSTKPPS